MARTGNSSRALALSSPDSDTEQNTDPRAQLLWSIVGKATSTDWQKTIDRKSEAPVSPSFVEPEVPVETRQTPAAQCIPQKEAEQACKSLLPSSTQATALAQTIKADQLSAEAGAPECWRCLPLELVPAFAAAAADPALLLTLSGVCR